MRRRVVRQGAATYTISLPAKWIREFGIKAGGELNVQERGKEVVISPERVVSEKRREINVTGLEPNLVRHYIQSMYIRGVDEITITSSDPKLLKVAQSMGDSLIGMAIVEQKGNAVILREVSIPKHEEFDALMRRVFFSIKSIGEESLDRLKAKDWSGLSEMKLAERASVGRITQLCMRMLNKEGYVEFSKTAAMFDIVRILENIGDEYTLLNEYLAEATTKPSGDTLEMYKKVNDLIDDVYLILYKFDKERLSATYQKIKRIRRAEMDRIIMKKSKEEAIVLHRLRKISELMGSILEEMMIVSL